MEAETSNKTLNKKLVEARLQKYSHVLVVGEVEEVRIRLIRAVMVVLPKPWDVLRVSFLGPFDGWGCGGDELFMCCLSMGDGRRRRLSCILTGACGDPAKRTRGRLLIKSGMGHWWSSRKGCSSGDVYRVMSQCSQVDDETPAMKKAASVLVHWNPDFLHTRMPCWSRRGSENR